MTPREEKRLFNELKSLRVQIEELKTIVSPYVPKEDKFLSTKEAAELLRWSERKLMYKIESGEICFATREKEGKGNPYRFSRNAILAYLNRL